jgi:hypothetical protein
MSETNEDTEGNKVARVGNAGEDTKGSGHRDP